MKPAHRKLENAAVKAGAHALRGNSSGLNLEKLERELAGRVVRAVIPVIRRELAAEVEASGRADVEWLAANRKDKLDMGRLIGSEDAWKDALRIIRGES